MLIEIKGGPSSGNWGHRGVPGQRGGSAPNDGGADAGSKSMSEALANYKGGPIYSMMKGELKQFGRWQDDDYHGGFKGSQANYEKQINATVKEIADRNPDISYVAVDHAVKSWIAIDEPTKTGYAQYEFQGSLEKLSLQKAMSDEFGKPMSDYHQKQYDALMTKRNAEIEMRYQDYKDSIPKGYGKYVNGYDEKVHTTDESLRALAEVNFAKERGNENLKFAGEQAQAFWNHPGAYERPPKNQISPTDALRAIVRTQHELTQEKFAAANIKSVRMYRGVATTEKLETGRTHSIFGNNGDSWSVDPRIAKLFSQQESDDYAGRGSGRNGYVITADVPVSQILSTPFTGFGAVSLGEFVTINLNGQFFVVSEEWLDG